jgi:chemotaxis signal transduction protein
LLLINPGQLNPLCREATNAAVPAFVQLPLSDDPRAEPVAVVFSTTVLPSTATNRFALSARQVAAIVQPTEMLGVPGSAAHVSGLTLWRDVVVPVFDFREEKSSSGANRRRLIARCGVNAHQSLIAFEIDAEVSMHKPAADDRLVPDAPCPSFAAGIYNINGDQVALLDPDALAKFETGLEN